MGLCCAEERGKNELSWVERWAGGRGGRVDGAKQGCTYAAVGELVGAGEGSAVGLFGRECVCVFENWVG